MYAYGIMRRRSQKFLKGVQIVHVRRINIKQGSVGVAPAFA